MPTQSIIVYRNPMEQAMWEGSYGGELVPIGAGLLVFLILVVAIQSYVIEKSKWGSKVRKYQNLIMFGPAIAVGIAVAKYLWLD